MRYRRSHQPGAVVFITLVTHRRLPLLADTDIRAALRRSAAHVASRHPFTTLAYVVLPDHCHLLWRMPDDDGDFSRRVRLIKHGVSRALQRTAPLWQARFWDHLIRDADDFHRHLDYIHFNPVKHGYVVRAAHWPDSSFHRYVERGWYTEDWGVNGTLEVGGE